MINISVLLLTLFHPKVIRPKTRRPAGENYIHISKFQICKYARSFPLLADVVHVHVIQIDDVSLPNTSGKTRLSISLRKEIEDITCPRVDMNFIFEWSTRYLTSERSERVRYRVDHEKIKFISISGHVMFCLLYKHQ